MTRVRLLIDLAPGPPLAGGVHSSRASAPGAVAHDAGRVICALSAKLATQRLTATLVRGLIHTMGRWRALRTCMRTILWMLQYDKMTTHLLLHERGS